MKQIIIIMMLAWYSPNKAVDVYDPLIESYWTNLENSIDNDLQTFAFEAFPAACRPVQFEFDDTTSLMVYISGTHNIEVEYQLGNDWYVLYSGEVEGVISLNSYYPTGNIRIYSLEPENALEIRDVYIPEPFTVVLLGLGLLFLRRK